MLTLNAEYRVPRGGWRWKPPGSDKPLVGGSLSGVVDVARNYCVGNGIPIPPDFREKIIEEMCVQNNWVPAYCKHREARRPDIKTRKLNATDLRNFLAVLGTWMKTKEFVTQEEADRRGAICAGCPRNIRVAGCYGCQSIVSKVTSVIGKRGTKHDNELFGCEICGCENRSQIHVPLDVLAKGTTPEMEFPEWCWKRAATGTP